MCSTDEEISWISWFTGLRGNEYFCEIDQDYIEDKFNLTGLSEQTPHYRHAIDVILDRGIDDMYNDEEEQLELAAEMLYGLIHARYILTNRGIQQMIEKWRRGDFGYCSRVHCERCPMLPIGLSDSVGESTVKCYCPKCDDVYHPKSKKHTHRDGAYFGTGFPHMMFMVHPTLRPQVCKQKFVPSLYGFKIHGSAYSMQIKAAERKRAVEKQVMKMPSVSGSKRNATAGK